MVFEENFDVHKILKEKREECLKLLISKKYSQLINMCTRLTQDYMFVKSSYDRTNITPYDKNLMQKFNLKKYVNASLIEKYKFIAAQLPKSVFKDNFLSLIINSKCQLIISLVDCKDEDYFDECKLLERNLVFYNKKISFVDEIYRLKGNFSVRRLRFLNWKDFSIPNKEEFSNFMQYYQKINYSSFVIVHCFAGVGRTGTFIMFDILSRFKKVTNENFIDLFLELRSFRNCLVYNDLQFKFLLDYFMQNK